MYYLYILYSSKINKYYIGISQNPERRLKFHNSIEKGWTKRGKPWVKKFEKGFQNREMAHGWEIFLKRQKSRRIIEKVISGEFVFSKPKSGN